MAADHGKTGVMRTDRLQALADGVFAIALTLLVLELPLPKESTHLGQDLLRAWPSYLAYALSFITVSIVWVNHHRLMDTVKQADRTLLELNLLLLLFVAAVPWPTGLLADYIRDPEQGRAAAVAYGTVMTLMSVSFTLIWVWLARSAHLTHPDTRSLIPSALKRSMVGPAIYIVSTGLAFLDAAAACVLFAVITCYFAYSGRRAA